MTMLLVAVLLLSLLVRQASWGNGPACTSVSGNDASIFSRPVAVPGVARGAHAALGSVTICTNSPTSALRLAGLLVAWPYTILWLIFLFRLNGLLKAASLPGGLYSPVTASRLRRLGWLLTLGGLTASIIRSSARIVIFTSLFHYRWRGQFVLGQISFSFTTLIVGLTLITVARVMGLGVKMREELDVIV
ncbi:MAG TPA: DUF2975 domain-containing protein [Streptosporangiaceae bacterium]